MQNLTYVGKTKNDMKVWVDLVNSHAATHLQHNSKLLGALREALAQTAATSNRLEEFHVKLPYEVGLVHLVKTVEGDEVFYAKRPNREKFTRFVNNKNAKPAGDVTFRLEKIKGDNYNLFTVFVGAPVPTFPFGKSDTNEEAKKFWSNHALTSERVTYIEETVTKECPW